MARFGKLPIAIPEGVTLAVIDLKMRVEGPKGALEKELPAKLTIKSDGKIAFVEAVGRGKQTLSIQGTTRSHLMNMITGVTQGWKKTLELVGSGYRAEVVGRELVLTVGFSHPVKVVAPEKVNFLVEKNIITVEGIDKEMVSQSASNIELACRVSNRDRRIFMDGVWLINKDGKNIK